MTDKTWWFVVEGLVRETHAQAMAACRRYGYDPATIRKVIQLPIDPRTGRPISQLELARRSATSPHGPIALGTVRRLLNPAQAPGCALGSALALLDVLHGLGCPATSYDLVQGALSRSVSQSEGSGEKMQSPHEKPLDPATSDR